MAVRKIKGSWWVDFVFNAERMRKRSPSNTRSGAEDYEVQLRQLVARCGSVPEALKTMEPKDVEKPLTFAAFAERWMRDYAAVNNKPTEVRNKHKALRNYLLPALGELPLAEVTALRIEQLKGQMRAADLCAKSINTYLAVLHKCLASANEWGFLDVLPRIKPLATTHPTVTYLTVDETRRLLTAVPENILRAMILVAAQTGLRYCELIALRWDDLDFVTGKICVCRAEVDGIVGTPKNNRIRYVPMTRAVRATFLGIARTNERVFHRSGVTAPKSLYGSPARGADVSVAGW